MGLWELDSSGGTLASGTWASKPLGYLGYFLSGFLCSPPELVFGEPRRTGGTKVMVSIGAAFVVALTKTP